jgi:hypothetical protein
MAMKRGDLGILAVLVICIAILFAFMWHGEEDDYSGKTFAKISVDGELYQSVELTAELQEIEIRTDRGYNLIRIYDKAVQIQDADCPDRLCVHMGAIRKIGERVVCLPNRVLVEIVGESVQSIEGDDVDAIVS